MRWNKPGMCCVISGKSLKTGMRMFEFPRTVSFVFLLVSLLCHGLADRAGATTYAPTHVDMTLKKVSQHVYFVQGKAGIATDNEGFISNAGVVITDAGIVVFDSLGTPSLAYKLLGLIREVSDKPILRVITSHYHADHIYGLQVFEDLGADIWAPAGAENYLRSEGAAERLEERRLSLGPWVNDDTRLVEPDRYIDQPEVFTLGDVKMTVVPVGAAHSDGDMTLYVEPDGVLFSGDIIFEGRIPFMGDANSRHWLEVLQHKAPHLAGLCSYCSHRPMQFCAEPRLTGQEAPNQTTMPQQERAQVPCPVGRCVH